MHPPEYPPPQPPRPQECTEQEWKKIWEKMKHDARSRIVKFYWTRSSRDTPPVPLDFDKAPLLKKEGVDLQVHVLRVHALFNLWIIHKENVCDSDVDEDWSDDEEMRLVVDEAPIPDPWGSPVDSEYSGIVPETFSTLRPLKADRLMLLEDLQFTAWTWYGGMPVHAINSTAFPPLFSLGKNHTPSLYEDGTWGPDEITQFPRDFDPCAPWMAYVSLEDALLKKKLSKADMQLAPKGSSGWVMRSELAEEVRNRRNAITRRYMELAPIAWRYPSCMNQDVKPANIPSFTAARTAAAYALLALDGVPTWKEFLLAMHVLRDGMLELDAFNAWAEDMGRWARGYPAIPRLSRGAIFREMDRMALETYASRGVPVYFANEKKIHLRHMGTERRPSVPLAVDYYGRTLFTQGYSILTTILRVLIQCYAPDQKHALPLRYYPPVGTRGIEFKHQACQATSWVDEHRPTERLAQQMEAQVKRAEGVAREAEKKRKVKTTARGKK